MTNRKQTIYRVKPEYIDRWTNEPTDQPLLLTDQEIQDLAYRWDKDLDDLFEQVTPYEDYMVYWTGGERDGEELAHFDSEWEAIQFARKFEAEHADEFEPDCGGVGIVDQNGDTVYDW